MSTTFHTPISTGAAANAGTINAPLGTLDAAISTVDNRVSGIIASSGTSSTETVDAREGYALLVDRMRRAYQYNNVLLVDAAYGSNSAGAHRYTTIAAAMAAAAAGTVIMLAPGVYSETVTFGADDIKLIGAGAAGYDSAGNTFGTGTIVNGTINLNNKKRVLVSDLTVNASGGLLDGVVSGYSMAATPLHQEMRNLVIVGSGPDAGVHGIVCHAGTYVTIDNIRVYKIGHGVAIRTSLANVTRIYAESCNLSAVIVKAASGSGDAKWVNVDNVIVNGGQGVVVQSYDVGQTAAYINISNVTTVNTTTCVYIQQVAGTCRFVNVVNCASYASLSATLGAFNVESAADVTFTNCLSHLAAAYGFKNTSGSRIYLNACIVQNPTVTKVNGAFAMLQLNGSVTAGAVAATAGAFSCPNNAWNAITGFAAAYDMIGITNSGYIVVPITGLYRVRGRLSFASNSTGVRGIGFGIVAGAQFGQAVQAATGASLETGLISEYVISLTAAQGIQLQCYQNSGGALNVQANAQLTLELLEAS